MARSQCPAKIAGCDFSHADHKTMEAHGETCDDWRRKRREGHEFCRRLEANVQARLDGKPIPYPDLLKKKHSPKGSEPQANDFWSQP